MVKTSKANFIYFHKYILLGNFVLPSYDPLPHTLSEFTHTNKKHWEAFCNTKAPSFPTLCFVMPKAKETIAPLLLDHQIFNNGNDNNWRWKRTTSLNWTWFLFCIWFSFVNETCHLTWHFIVVKKLYQLKHVTLKHISNLLLFQLLDFNLHLVTIVV